MAGLTCYQSERFYYVFGVTAQGKDKVLVLAKTEKGQTTVLASAKLEDAKAPVTLQVQAEGTRYKFNYSMDGRTFVNVGGTVPGDILSTNVAGGFTGSLIGLYGTTANTILP